MPKSSRASTFGEKALHFYLRLSPPRKLPPGVSVINPHEGNSAAKYVTSFFEKYFADKKRRIFIFGINPGRFGSGVTSIPFTDPVALEHACGIKNDFEKRRELSSRFVYRFIQQWGGPKEFYKNFFLTAISPVGFTKAGKNYNYYDDPSLFQAVRPYIIKSIQEQIAFGSKNVAVLFGSGKNFHFFNEINKEFHFFKKIYALEHPRFIMQYKSKDLEKYLTKYNQIFSESLRDTSG